LAGNASIGLVAADDGIQRPVATDLLVDDDIDVNVALGLQPRGQQAFRRHNVAGDTTFHVGGAAPIDAAVLDGGGPWIIAPSLAATDRDDIGMAVQEQRASPARALQCGDDVGPSFVASINGPVPRMLLQLFPICFPHIDIETDLRHVICKKLLDLGLVTGDAGNSDHLLQKRDRFVAAVVDLFQKRLRAIRAHLRCPHMRPQEAVIKRRFSPQPSRAWLGNCSRRAMAATMRCGVMGDINSSTPSGRSASLTALAMAAGGAMAPPSPIPLTPNSV